MRITTITISGSLADAKPPIPLMELRAVGEQGGSGLFRTFKPDEEKAVAQWVLDTDIGGLEKPLDDEELIKIVTGEKRSSGDQDRRMARWVLQAWEVIRTRIDA